MSILSVVTPVFNLVTLLPQPSLWWVPGCTATPSSQFMWESDNLNLPSLTRVIAKGISCTVFKVTFGVINIYSLLCGVHLRSLLVFFFFFSLSPLFPCINLCFHFHMCFCLCRLKLELLGTWSVPGFLRCQMKAPTEHDFCVLQKGRLGKVWSSAWVSIMKESREPGSSWPLRALSGVSCDAFSNIAKLSFPWLSHSPCTNDVSELYILRNLSLWKTCWFQA